VFYFVFSIMASIRCSFLLSSVSYHFLCHDMLFYLIKFNLKWRITLHSFLLKHHFLIKNSDRVTFLVHQSFSKISHLLKANFNIQYFFLQFFFIWITIVLNAEAPTARSKLWNVKKSLKRSTSHTYHFVFCHFKRVFCLSKKLKKMFFFLKTNWRRRCVLAW
jgi:hypothetical protein